MRILVAYETAYGSTAETAEAIGEALRACGSHVDVVRCREVRSVDGYDAFVVGAPVWASNWLKPAQAFVRRFREALARHPTAYFHASGAAGEAKTRDDIVEIMEPRLRRYAPEVEPVAIGAVGGVVDFDAYSLPIRLLMKAVVGRAGGPTSGRHDLRDWEQIRTWASQVYDIFAARASVDRNGAG